jgi:zinc transporter ZupT
MVVAVHVPDTIVASTPVAIGLLAGFATGRWWASFVGPTIGFLAGPVVGVVVWIWAPESDDVSDQALGFVAGALTVGGVVLGLLLWAGVSELRRKSRGANSR